MKSFLFLILLIKLICIWQNTFANEVLGCGGFIKSHADIDFSKVEIKLLTKNGALKDKSDCSPSNGYYFLPIYDKGDYILRVSPPPGWSFEPEEFRFNFDGKNDVCSLGKDVNFNFKGFGITGKVALAGYDNAGAHNVNVELRSEDGKDVRRTVSDLNGIFSFSPVIPGKYFVRASHKYWHFSKAEHTVIVESGNTELPVNSLVVSGFDVIGRFDANGQEAVGVGVALFKTKNQMLPMKCNNLYQQKLSMQSLDFESSSSCYADVNKDGSYILPGVAPGKYVLQPVVRASNLNLHISPSFIEFVVEKDNLQLKEEFQITGFSVTGKILRHAGGAPLPGAIVKLNGKQIATTGADGSYTLENVKSGSYALHVEVPQMEFVEEQLKLKISSPTIPDIVPNGYEVCGKVISTKSHVIGITKLASTFHTTVSSKAKTGEWCVFLPSGRYNVELLTTEEEKRSGIQFYPAQQQIEVLSEPISGITFSQLRATLTGEIKCLPDAPIECTAIEVTLHALDASGQATGQKTITQAKGGKYKFENVLPGPYEITIPQVNLCFDSTRVLVNIATTTESASPFVHRGYEISLISSHRGTLKYTHNSPDASTESLKLLSGVNTFCVPKYGSYKFKVEGCHLYEENTPNTFDTKDTKPVLITAIAHKTGIGVLSTEPTADNIKLHIESNTLGEEVITPIAEVQKVDGKYAFRYDTYLKPEEVLRITPKSDILLFTPQELNIIGTNDCVDTAFNFIAARGLILRGKVVPPIKDVKITLNFPNQPEIQSETALTTISGEFRFGPIDENLEYALTAEKDSYVFSSYNRGTASFNAHKLCEIVVKVKDTQDKELSGVLLSLSGAESYRKNLVTGEDGTIVFHSLSPSQYFLRPMMKEYKFEPNSKMIDIKDGETATVELVGKRVAYSIFGKITSLNGEPFAHANVEAISDDKCMHHQEEAASENNGQYRLRGLQPGCTYTIRLKKAANVERSIPKSRTVTIENEDVHDIKLIAISPIGFVDVTARIMAKLNEHYKTLRIVMYRKGASDSPIYSQKVDTPLNPKLRQNPGIMVFFPRIPLDGKTYIVELHSTLSDKLYSYVLPSEEFVANRSSVFVELDFIPEVRTTEGDLNQNSISALILVALVVIAFFKQDIAMDFLNFVWDKTSIIVDNFAQRQRNNKKDIRKNEPINQKEIELMAEQINAIKKKKTKKI